MNPSEHQRALDLVTESAVEGLAHPDEQWLQQHLAACADCAYFAESLGFAEQALRSVAVTASAELVAATQARVRIRALEMREQAVRVTLLSLSAVLSVASSLASYAYLRPVVLWLERQVHVPEFCLQASAVIVWFLPATIVALVLVLAPRRRRADRNLAVRADA